MYIRYSSSSSSGSGADWEASGGMDGTGEALLEGDYSELNAVSNRPNADFKLLMKIRNHAALVLASLLLNILLSVTLFIFVLESTSLQRSGASLSDGLEELSSRDYADDPCSGHGIYVAEKGTGSLSCRCDSACFTGDDCSTVHNDCVVDLNSGSPTVFERYWVSNTDTSRTVIEGWERLSYSGDEESEVSYMLMELEEAIRSIHKLVGNAVTDGRHIIVGTGSTQLFLASLFALSTLGKSKPTNVVAMAPSYNLYGSVSQYVDSLKFQWAGDATTFAQNKDGSEYIEVVTSPNNPSGDIRHPISNGTGSVVYDYAYYWPHFTPITSPVDDDLMLFTLSKCTGHAGTRIGWAIVKDDALAVEMAKFLQFNVVAVSKESQIRAAQMLRAAIAGYTENPRPSYVPKRTSSGDVDELIAGQALFHFASSEMTYRWARLRATLDGSVLFTVPEFPPAFCTYFGEMSTPAPAFAWFHCKVDENCGELMKRFGVLGRGGPAFSVDARFHRLTMISRRSTFEMFIARLEAMELAARQSIDSLQ